MINIRPATKDDISLINEMAQVTFVDTYTPILSPEQLDYMMDMMYSEKNIISHMEQESYQYFIANVDDGPPCAYLAVQTISEKEYCLQRVYVMPEMKGQGIGGFLIDLACDYALEKSGGECRIDLHVNRNNIAAQGVYFKKGFTIDYSRAFDIGGGFVMDDHIMAKNLQKA